MQDDPGKAKKEETPQGNPKKDKEIEVIMKEWEALRVEVVTHLEAQYQLTNVALLLLGGLITAITVLFISNGQGPHITTPSLYFVALLLVASPLFSSLLHAFLSHQLDLGYAGVYFQHVIRARICELLEIEKDSLFFFWDRYHQQQLTSRGRFGRFVSAMITTSHLGVVGILALLTFLAAIWAYVADFSLFTDNTGRWVALSLLIFDTFYFLASIPVGVHAINTFEQILKEGLW